VRAADAGLDGRDAEPEIRGALSPCLLVEHDAPEHLIALADKAAHARAALGFEDRRLGRGFVDQGGPLDVKPVDSGARREDAGYDLLVRLVDPGDDLAQRARRLRVAGG
jgi:hypothetical protein